MIKLKIISSYEIKECEVVWLEALTAEGSFIIQKHHAPTTFSLSNNKEFTYRYKTGKQETLFLKQGGLLEITPDEARLIID